MVVNDVDAMWFLPSALNVKVKKFNQARVNGGSNYDSLTKKQKKRSTFGGSSEQAKSALLVCSNSLS